MPSKPRKRPSTKGLDKYPCQLTERVQIAIYRPQFCDDRLAVPVAVNGNRGRLLRFWPGRPPGIGKNSGETSLARIAGVNIPTNKRVVIALQYIHGIGPTAAKKIVEAVHIPAERRTNQLTDAEVAQIREVIDRDFLVEGDLRREVAVNIKRLMDLGCYRGLRHRRGLPVRGQRTHTNARTRKGPARAIAGKKK